jgi:hypothetical protein
MLWIDDTDTMRRIVVRSFIVALKIETKLRREHENLQILSPEPRSRLLSGGKTSDKSSANSSPGR